MSCPPLTTEERSAIQARIVNLQAAYASLISGTAVRRFVDQNGEQVEYTVANIAKLDALIKSLKAMVDCSFARAYRPRPMGFVFPRQ